MHTFLDGRNHKHTKIRRNFKKSKKIRRNKHFCIKQTRQALLYLVIGHSVLDIGCSVFPTFRTFTLFAPFTLFFRQSRTDPRSPLPDLRVNFRSYLPHLPERMFIDLLIPFTEKCLLFIPLICHPPVLRAPAAANI